jgi:probable HAF family extracellular repeat protein
MRALRLRCSAACASLIVGLLWGGEAGATATFTELTGSGVFSEAWGISADGSTVVGYSSDGTDPQPFRWTVATGSGAALSGRPDGSYGYAQGVSGDGSAVVGYYNFTGAFPGYGYSMAFRWTSGGGMVGLGDLPGGQVGSYALDVSADGSTVVGYGTTDSGREAFRWTSGGLQGLGDLPGGQVDSIAWGISADGATIAGSSDGGGNQAFLWTTGGGMSGLGDLPGGGFGSLASAISANGSTVVGSGAGASGEEAFRWTSGGGMVGLGNLPNATSDKANDVSGDGSTIVGTAVFDNGQQYYTKAFIWDASNGMRDLQTVLTDLGLGPALSGWTLSSAYAISDDGLTIAGSGTGPHGLQGWVATIPEPGTGVLVVAGLLALGAWRRARA